MPIQSDAMAFYECFWLLPHVLLPLPLEFHGDASPAVVEARHQLLSNLNEVNDQNVSRDQLQAIISQCEQYLGILLTQTDMPRGDVLWRSSLLQKPVSLPMMDEESMVLSLLAMLLLRQAACVAQFRDPGCIPEAANYCTRAAGVLDHLCERQSEEKGEKDGMIPDLTLSILRAMRDVALAMAQQLAIVKATLYYTSPYSKSVLQKLHTACQVSYESYEAAIMHKYSIVESNRPSLHPRALFRFVSIFSRLHHALALQLEGELLFGDDTNGPRVGEAIAFIDAAIRQLSVRQSIRDVGLPPFLTDDELTRSLTHPIEVKRCALVKTCERWNKDNDLIYFAKVPSEAETLSVRLSQAFIMKLTPYDSGHLNESGDEVGSAEEENDDENEDEGDGEEGPGAEYEENSGEEDEEGEENGGWNSSNGAECEDLQHIGPIAEDVPPIPEDYVAPDTLPELQQSRPSMLYASDRVVRTSMSQGMPPKARTSRDLMSMQSETETDSQAPSSRMSMIEKMGRQKQSEDALARMQAALALGLPVTRLSGHGRWKKGTLVWQEDCLVLIKRQALAMFTIQRKFPWTSIQAIQLELQAPRKEKSGANVPPRLDNYRESLTSILIVVSMGDKVNPVEVSLQSSEANACAVACLQRHLQEKKRAGRKHAIVN
ncbi:hypothetical protein Poli38472_009788 [Pythium oligandrum]|uniref:BRO1 domain-containing protein n=1 Tax=Pythium oligandrum TaxID=41045 RepID=A0A8K1FG22_PYTOL|nr:hypothetical protein Poli38472_009788 [Pythium oligandrum]|eukprot:TMW62295.1 hypothetical protein Poli38472_009788 [Pythium oligandrum]